MKKRMMKSRSVLAKRRLNMPVRPTQCATCPFRKNSPYRGLALDLAESALTKRSRICHSTGSNNAINHRTGQPEMLCRGARDLQLEAFVSIGFLPEATDAAWQAKCKEMGL